MNGPAIITVDETFGASSDGANPGVRDWRRPLYVALSRMRYQYLGGAFFSTALPAAFAWPGGDVFAHDAYVNSLLAAVFAFSLGFLFFRKLTAYPGVRAMGYIAPAYAAAYGATALGFAVLGLEYSVLQIGVGFFLAVGWFLAVFILGRRSRPLQLAIVPGGAAERVAQLPNVRTRLLAAPELTAVGGAPIVADFRAALTPEWERFIADAALSGRQVYHIKQIEESLSGRVNVEHLSENPIGSLSPGIIYAHVKRYLDSALALFVLIALSPALLALALAIRLESPGKAIFAQKRIGVGGAPFTMMKFRSMREPTKEELADPAADLRHDETRVTRIGRFIRRTRLDELPQLINILRGEMSWIGPRPESVGLADLYETQVPFYRYRHVVRPGITGWAQVNQGHVVGVDDATEKLQYDFFYVKHFSLWLDMLVVLRTVRVVLTGHGAR